MATHFISLNRITILVGNSPHNSLKKILNKNLKSIFIQTIEY